MNPNPLAAILRDLIEGVCEVSLTLYLCLNPNPDPTLNPFVTPEP